MTIIERSAIVAYSQRQMFELVNGIEEYSRFIPWCPATHIFERTETEVEASIEVSWSGVHKSFTTRNKLHRFDRMDIALVSGPFRRLEGHWEFQALGDEGCKVCLKLEFELAGNFMDRMLQPLFHHMANSLVEVFCKRAVEVYGS